MLITTAYSPKFAPIGDLCAKSWESYALAAGYEFNKHTIDQDGPCASWEKLGILRVMLDSSGHDQVMWVDADSMVIDHSVRINFPGELYFAQDGNGLCGSHILARRTVDVMRFLDAVTFLRDPESHLHHTTRKW